MSLRRVGQLAVAGLAAVISISCGQVYRPVVLPVGTTPPNPASFHAVFGINANLAANPGTALQIDVSGDSNIGVANMGINPTHAAILPNNSRVFVTSANTFDLATNSLNTGGVDTVTAFSPAVDSTFASGLGNPTIFTLPNVNPSQSATITSISETGGVVTVNLSSALNKAAVGGTIVITNVPVTGYNGSFIMTSVAGTTIQYNDSITGLAGASAGTASIPIPLTCSYRPDFVTTTQPTSVYVANYGFENDPDCNRASTDSVAILNPSLNNISFIQYLAPGAHPVAMVETPDALNLYVLNQNNTIVDLSPVDLSILATVALPAGSTTPVWAAARPDSQEVYVVTQSDGLLHTISTVSNSVTSSQFVGGPGANFVLYDKSRNRLYVTNPGNGSSPGAVYVFDATTTMPTPLGSATGVVNVPVPAPCLITGVTCTPVTPVSVTALADGSRFYVASYVLATAPGGGCPDPNVTTSGCMIPQLTVFDAASLTVKPSTSLSMLQPSSVSLLAQPQFLATQYAVPAQTSGPSCAPAATFLPETIRFRMFTTASADSSHVYVSICDAGAIADISATTSTLPTGGTNTPDVLVTDLAAPFGAGSTGSGEPTLQNPIFLLTGQ